MLILPVDGVEDGEILLHVVGELEPGTSRLGGHCRPPPGVRESTESALGAEIVILARLDWDPLFVGHLPSPPVHLLPPLLYHHTVGKFAPTVGKESAGVTIPAWPRPTMFGLHVILHFTLVKALDFTFSTLDGSQENSLFLHHW